MRTLGIALLAVGLVAVPAPARVPERDVVQEQTGKLCGFASTTDPSSPSVQTGVMHGGPVTAAEVTADPAATISLTCTVQVFAPTHAHPDAVSRSAGGGDGVAHLQPTAIGYDLPHEHDQPVYLCSQATVAGQPYYWDALGGAWSTSADVRCVLAAKQRVPPPVVWDYADQADAAVNAVAHQCGDGLDNDLDGRADYPADPGCDSPHDLTEAI